MVERWNIGSQKDKSHFKFFRYAVGGWTINPSLRNPMPASGQDPLFQL